VRYTFLSPPTSVWSQRGPPSVKVIAGGYTVHGFGGMADRAAMAGMTGNGPWTDQLTAVGWVWVRGQWIGGSVHRDPLKR
jgi:hypothetical protein